MPQFQKTTSHLYYVAVQNELEAVGRRSPGRSLDLNGPPCRSGCEKEMQYLAKCTVDQGGRESRRATTLKGSRVQRPHLGKTECHQRGLQGDCAQKHTNKWKWQALRNHAADIED